MKLNSPITYHNQLRSRLFLLLLLAPRLQAVSLLGVNLATQPSIFAQIASVKQGGVAIN